jgi:hypothetical protein
MVAADVGLNEAPIGKALQYVGVAARDIPDPAINLVDEVEVLDVQVRQEWGFTAGQLVPDANVLHVSADEFALAIDRRERVWRHVGERMLVNDRLAIE